MRVHLYSPCWNEERIIPFYLRHYEPLVDRIVIFDDNSTDRSRELLRQSPKVEMRQLEQAASSQLAMTTEVNRCWKESRGRADWVFITDFDEFLYHPRLLDYLGECQAKGFTIFQPVGLDMVSPQFPDKDAVLTNSVRRGRPLDSMDKPIIFDPNAIEEMNFEAGRHAAEPSGRVVFPPTREVKLLHYKHLGADYLVSRTNNLRSRRTDLDRQVGWSFHWDRPEEQLRSSFERMLSRSQEVI